MIKRVLSKLRKVTMSLFAVLCAGAVWAEEGEVTTPEVTPEPDPAPSTSALSIDPSAGYVLTGLGELGDQAAVVFTNSEAAANWTVPRNLKNVEILVVGGGGGGGGHYYNATAKNCQGGAGGGAGAVVTGFIKDLAADQVVNVTVGAGGAGGAATTSATTGAGKGGNGGNSIIKVGDLTYVTAYGGGGDGGYNSAGVANGGSNSGVRGTKTAANLKSVTVVGEGAENLVSDIVARANKGGGGYSTTSGYPGAGGGGADGVGHPTYGGSSCGGTGGFGYVSYITGERVVYGAGGGGGIGKNGGDATYLEDGWLSLLEGAGLGKAGQPGSDALANQGAGGGGGSWKCAGGAGGSGIVVLRFGYVTDPISVDINANILPKISDKAYTGEVLVSGLENTYAYAVEELGERINVGQQTVRVTLNDGYVWADGDTNKTKEFTWNITQEANNWKVEPYLSHTAWPDNFASSVNFKFTAPETSFGVLQSEFSANGAAPQPFSGTLPTEPGSYTLKYWVEGNDNWAAKEWTVNFKIYRSEAFAEGYKVYGLGENGDEVAVVFTQNATWTVPANLKSAQFLVVGGGGGGGADPHYDAAAGGAGGGGGGVVTGEVDLTKAATVAVTIGAGGAGGVLSTDQKDGASSGYYYGGSKKGGNTTLAVGGTTYVTAYGGGRDQGVTKKNSSSITTANMREGGQGGSNGGSRGGITADQSKNPTMGAVASNAALRNCITYGNKGGKGCSDYFYGYPSAGGGGGATEAGGDAGNDAAGWPGGKGGEGLASDITGALLVYGSGGGGASTQGALGGVGGSGAGNGGDREDAQGTSALANQGGGGGGTSRETTNGGNGGSGVVVIRYSVYEAEVVTAEGSTLYATFAEAFDAAQAGETVKLLNDVTLAEKLTIKKAVTLDLNGCTLSETVTDNYGALYVGTAGNLTITDSAEGGKIATDGGVVVGNYGTVTVNGGTIEAGAVAEDDVAVYNFYYNGSTYGKLTVTGGKVGRIWNCGNANITAGEVVDIDNSGAMTIAAAATVFGTVIIKNGSDAAEVPGAGTLTAPESLTVQVGNEGAEAFYVDGKWLVQVVVATIGEAKFATLDAAIAAAQAADTITLVKDIELTAFVSIAKSLTLELNGKSINRADGTALYVNGDATVTIQSEGSVSGAQAVYVGAGTVVIKGGNFHGYNGGHAVYVQGTGKVEILDGTFSIDPSGSYNYVLNKYDADRETTSIVVKGGKFKGFNPADNGAEGANTDFCADGLCGYVVETVDGVDVYGVAAVVATIGEAKFASLDAAIAAAGAEDEVVVVADIATDAAFEITKKVAVNLNGKTIATTQADTEGNGVFWVKAGGELTLNGEGTVNGVGGNAYNIAIWADGGKVIINGGTYTNEGAQDDGPDGAHFDLIYVKNGGAVEINGGTFKCQTPEWTLNSHDTKKGTIVVNGGLFYQFNPSDCATEGAGTNWCAEGLKGAESVENAGYYEIVDAWTAPLPEKDGEAPITEEYTSEVFAALEAAVATSVDVKVNGVELKGNEAVKALNTAVASFDDALTFDGTAATLDIEIKVTEVNTEDPAASTVVVKRGTEELTVKATPTVKYFYPETKTWGSDKPESGAVLFKLVF